ncbi:MAG: M48 family metallopeptidase [Alphaproteobacteria bacterium]|nr:M48 family metallopeptidase [Alphaproteobacteria bacterium]OJV11988.1 MAG: hypothetical protein BGO27_06450 [Alphaproteobacteria bacterium 33-17]
MNILVIGKTEIPYKIRLSTRAKKTRIIVSPNNVEVVVPHDTDISKISHFVNSKKEWVYNKYTEISHLSSIYVKDNFVTLQSGAKVLYRGRQMMVKIHKVENDYDRIEFKNRFNIYVPSTLLQNQIEKYAATTLKFWLKSHLKKDVRDLIKHYTDELSVKCSKIRINNSDTFWGSCNKKGAITINWNLIAAPKPVLAYVVLHEVCHLVHHNHSKEFWTLLQVHMPDYLTKKEWLKANKPNYSL